MLASVVGYLVLLLVLIGAGTMDQTDGAQYGVTLVLQIMCALLSWGLPLLYALPCGDDRGCGAGWEPSYILRAMQSLPYLLPILIGACVICFAVLPSKKTAVAAPALLAIGVMISHSETVFNPPRQQERAKTLTSN